jgi:nucleotide-binding universal stress UspA family protein
LRRLLIPYAEQWQADLIVLCAGRGNALLRRMFGNAALDVLNETSCALYLGE